MCILNFEDKIINLFAFFMNQGCSKHNKNILLSHLIFNQKQINNYIFKTTFLAIEFLENI
jgi:hypothetical protein